MPQARHLINFEASSITIDYLWEIISNELGDSLIIGIPAKDLVFISRISDKKAIIELKFFIEETFKDCNYLLSRCLFKYERNLKIWSLYEGESN